MWAAAGAVVALELAVSSRYGLHRDELEFLVAGAHTALGYVDQPPFAPVVAHLAWSAWRSPVAIRLLPALCAGATVLVAALTARRLGGGWRAQALTAVATGCAPVLLAAGHLGGTTVYDLLAWSVATFVLLGAVASDRRSDWLLLGLVVGLGLWNKDLLLLWAGAVGLGLLLTPTRRVLRTPGPWLATAVAVVVAAPLLVWQATHGWPVLAMSSRLRVEHSTAADRVSVVPAFVILGGVLTFPLAVVGTVALLRDRAGRRWLGLAALLVAAYVAVVIPGRAYYAAGFLPALFAAGAVAVDRTTRRAWLWFAAPVVGALVVLPVTLPVVPVDRLASVPAERALNHDAGETVGWPELVRAVEGVVASLPPSQRASSVYTENYGEAGALRVEGNGLPPVLSGHDTFGALGPGRASDTTVVAVGAAADLRPWFSSCRPAVTFRSPYGVVNDEDGVVISVCTGPRAAWTRLWPALRHLG